MAYGTFNNRKIAFKCSNDFDIVDMNNSGYIVILGNNNAGSSINLAVRENSGDSLKDICNRTVEDFRKKGLKIFSSKVSRKFGKTVLAIDYLQTHEGVNVIRKSIGFVVNNDFYTFEYAFVEGKSISKDEEAFRIAIESFEVNKAYY